MLSAQSNLAITYRAVGRDEQALRLRREVYSGYLKLLGEEHPKTLTVANNYAHCLLELRHFEEAKPLLRKTIPAARRVLRDSNDLTIMMRSIYANSLSGDPAATLHDLREALNMLGELERTSRRVLGGAHPLTLAIERDLRDARAALAARKTRPQSSP